MAKLSVEQKDIYELVRAVMQYGRQLEISKRAIENWPGEMSNSTMNDLSEESADRHIELVTTMTTGLPEVGSQGDLTDWIENVIDQAEKNEHWDCPNHQWDLPVTKNCPLCGC